MEDRITLNLLYFGLISTVFTLILSCVAFQNSTYTQLKAELSRETALISAGYDTQDSDTSIKKYTSFDAEVEYFRPDGTIEYSTRDVSDADAETRSELSTAREQGTGFAARRSSNSGRERMYSARLLSDGSVLCLSIDAPRPFQFISQNFGYITMIFMVLILLALLFALLLTHRLISPIKKLPERLEQPGFDPKADSVYPELLPLLQKLKKRRDERESMRQEFTANVSHELKTPLTTISGYSEMITSGLAKPEDIPRFAEKIHLESERMQTLVGDIIELNALDSEIDHTHEDNVDLLSLVHDCVEQLSPHFSAGHLSVYVTGEGFTLCGNQRQLWELVYNLLDNARRYNVNGGMIRISVQDYVLSIKDTGIGIPKEHQSRIFKRFYRVDKSHSRATGGTGLGLSIVKHVAELHQATVELESTEHIGTEIRGCFSCWIYLAFT